LKRNDLRTELIAADSAEEVAEAVYKTASAEGL
jgi:hypothetical protein